MMPQISPAGNPGSPVAAQRGITLLEMLVVITILGLVTAALPLKNFTALNSIELKTLARAMARDLRLAQQEARRSNAAVSVPFDVEKRRFGKDIDVDEDIAIRFETSVEEASQQPANSIGQMGQIVFWPDGSSNGGRIALSRAGKTMTITTLWLTGGVEVMNDD